MMTVSQGIIQIMTQMVDSFVVVCMFFIAMSWLRLVVDAMSGRGA